MHQANNRKRFSFGITDLGAAKKIKNVSNKQNEEMYLGKIASTEVFLSQETRMIVKKE